MIKVNKNLNLTNTKLKELNKIVKTLLNQVIIDRMNVITINIIGFLMHY